MFKSRASIYTRVLVAVFSFSILTACTAGHAEQSNFDPNNPPLEAVSQFRDDFTEQVVQGTVRNTSGKEIEELEAVVEFLSATDRVLDIKIEELGTLAPNATKEFTARHPTQYKAVAVAHYRLRFRTRDHKQNLPYKDLSGNQSPQAGGENKVNYHYADPGGSNPLPPVTSGGEPSRADPHGSH